MREKLEKQECLPCQSCGKEGQKADGFCKDCSLSICGECIGHHSLLPITRNHKIVPLGAMPCLQATPTSEESSPARCPLHGTYALDLYCTELSCLVPICFKCTVGQHKGHDCIPIEDVDMEKHTSWLKMFSDNTQSNISILERANDQMQQSVTLLDAHSTEAHQKVSECAERLRKAVNERERHLHAQIDAVRVRRMETIRAQQATNTSLLNRMQHAKEAAEEVSSKATSLELLATAKTVTRHLVGLSVLCASSEPVVHLSNSVNVLETGTVEVLAKQIGEFGCLSEGSHPPNCTISPIPDALRINKHDPAVQFTVMTADRDKRLCSQGGDRVAAYLRSLTTPSPSIRADVTDNSDGTYTVTLKQFYLGRCGVHVTVNGQAISEEPAVVTVKAPLRNYKEIGEAKGELKFPPDTEVTSLCGICITKDGSICVSDRDRHVIHIFDRFREYVRTIGGAGDKHGQLCNPRGLAVSERDELYIACESRIDVLTLDGAFLRRFGTTGEGKINRAFDVAVADDKVLVANACNHSVTAFSRNGEFLYDFETAKPKELNNPTGVTVTTDGKVFVSDQTSHCLQVFSTTGKHIQQIGGLGHGSGPGQLFKPNNLAVTPGGFLLVPEIRNCRVSIFTSEGSFLHCFGKLGLAPGCFKFPFAVAVGNDETVFVTDCDGQRVQCF